MSANFVGETTLGPIATTTLHSTQATPGSLHRSESRPSGGGLVPVPWNFTGGAPRWCRT